MGSTMDCLTGARLVGLGLGIGVRLGGIGIYMGNGSIVMIMIEGNQQKELRAG